MSSNGKPKVIRFKEVADLTRDDLLAIASAMEKAVKQGTDGGFENELAEELRGLVAEADERHSKLRKAPFTKDEERILQDVAHQYDPDRFGPDADGLLGVPASLLAAGGHHQLAKEAREEQEFEFWAHERFSEAGTEAARYGYGVQD